MDYLTFASTIQSCVIIVSEDIMLKTIFIIIDILLVLLIVGAIMSFNFAVKRKSEDKRKKEGTGIDKATTEGWSIYKDKVKAGRNWFKEIDKKSVKLKSFDDLILKAYYLPADNPKGTVLLSHGYMSNGYNDFACMYEYLHNAGYNILNIFHRGCGQSSGEYICFGANERFDILSWLTFLNALNGEKQDIFIYGISLGASAALMACGLDLPGNVRGVIADCPFTNGWDEIGHMMKKKYHLPKFPLLYIVDGFCKLRAKFSLKEANCLDAVKTMNIPLLLIHGGSDDYVPTSMGQAIYDAATGEKELLIVPGAGHGLSFLTDEEAYKEKLNAFLERNASKTAD